MKEYIRFGEINKQQRSLNFFKVPLADAKDTCYMASLIEAGELPEEWLEKGLSVFEMVDGLPVLGTFELAKALSCRLNEDYIVTLSGEEVGTGADGEPLLANVTVLEEVSIRKEVLIGLITMYLAANYTTLRREEVKDVAPIYEHWCFEKNCSVITFNGVTYLA